MQKKLIGFLIKNGKKTAALKIFNAINKQISKTIPNVSISYLLSVFFYKLNTNIEIKKVSFRKRVHFIPTPIKYSRKLFLIFKWINAVLSNNKQKTTYSAKLYKEILTVLLVEDSSALLKMKAENELKAYQYKSKAHFRWH